MTTVAPDTAAEIMARLDALAGCTEEAGVITRLFLTPAHARAIALVREWMERAGLAVRLDASGTLVGCSPAPSDAPRLLLGSHIDSVRNAGRFDGCLGVVLAIALAGRARDLALPYALEVRAFGDEEGVRFPVTLTGAHAAAGTFDPAWLAVRDADCVSMGQALTAFGCDPQALASGVCRAQGAFAYVEVHIEQGPVLEAAGAPLGVVTAIAGATRLEVRVIGQAGHAGTVPMESRRDALAAACAMVLAVRETARAMSGVVATVGRLDVMPNAANVIAGACVFSMDLRAPDDANRRELEQRIVAALHRLAGEHDVTIAITRGHEAGATQCDARLQAVLAGAVAQAGWPVRHLASGAGHDAMAMAALCPVGMLFVRCAGGISHHPDESVSVEDVAAALEVMMTVLRTLVPA